jgi:hypothetical protein
MWTYPGTVPFSDGKVYWFFSDLTYSHRISEKISIGISRVSVYEYGSFDDFPDTQKKSGMQKLFVAWSL